MCSDWDAVENLRSCMTIDGRVSVMSVSSLHCGSAPLPRPLFARKRVEQVCGEAMAGIVAT
jgi:hypothetical protein